MERDIFLDREPVPDGFFEQLYGDLVRHLRDYGQVRYDRPDGTYSLLHTDGFGPIEVTDHATAQAHKQFRAGQAEPPDLDLVLEEGSPILTIACGGQLDEIEQGLTAGTWYYMAHPKDIRPHTLVQTVFEHAVSVTGPPRSAVAVFNMDGVLHAPNDCLREAARGLEMLA